MRLSLLLSAFLTMLCLAGPALAQQAVPAGTQLPHDAPNSTPAAPRTPTVLAGCPAYDAFGQIIVVACPAAGSSAGSGASGGSGSTGTKSLTLAPLSNVLFPANAATIAIAAGTIATGCDFMNTGTIPLYVSTYGTATAANFPLQPGQVFHCPGPTAQAVSIFNASTTTAGTIAGQVY